MKEQINEKLRERKEAYEAPTCEIIEMQNEGVLCSSYGAGTDSYDSNGNYGW